MAITWSPTARSVADALADLVEDAGGVHARHVRRRVASSASRPATRCRRRCRSGSRRRRVTRMRTSPGPACRSGTSTTCRTSGPPYSMAPTTRMAACLRGRRAVPSNRPRTTVGRGGGLVVAQHRGAGEAPDLPVLRRLRGHVPGHPHHHPADPRRRRARSRTTSRRRGSTSTTPCPASSCSSAGAFIAVGVPGHVAVAGDRRRRHRHRHVARARRVRPHPPPGGRLLEPTRAGCRSRWSAWPMACLGLLLIGVVPFGVDNQGDAELSVRITTIVVLVVDVGCVVVCVLKGKLKLALFGIFVSPIAYVGAIRLARPTSAWARRRYAAQAAPPRAGHPPGRPARRPVEPAGRPGQQRHRRAAVGARSDLTRRDSRRRLAAGPLPSAAQPRRTRPRSAGVTGAAGAARSRCSTPAAAQCGPAATVRRRTARSGTARPARRCRRASMPTIGAPVWVPVSTTRAATRSPSAMRSSTVIARSGMPPRSMAMTPFRWARKVVAVGQLVVVDGVRRPGTRPRRPGGPGRSPRRTPAASWPCSARCP